MPSKTLRDFWKKTPAPTGANVKPPISAKKNLAELVKQKALSPLELQQLTTKLDAYKNIDPANDQDCSQRMTALAEIDAEIHKWFRNTAVTSLAETRGAKAMAALLKKSEQAHEQLVDATKDDVNVVPFDTTGLTGAEVNRRKGVWRGIVDGTSQVELTGSDKFQKKTRAQVAKMLQTETGSNILDYLSQDQGTGAKDRLVIADKVPDDLKANQNLMANDREVSYALELTGTDADKNLGQGVAVVGDEDPAEYPTLAKTADLQAAIFAGAKGVIVGNKKYVFGPGSGSFVKTVPPRAGDEDSDTAGHGNSEIITPGFITLAHELGHAVNIRAGATTRDHPELMNALCKMQDPTLTDERIEQAWSNGEEYFNISNIENGMRRDCGLPQRVAHKPRTALVKMELVRKLSQRAIDMMNIDLCVSMHPDYQDLSTFLNANKGNTDDDGVVKQVVKKMERLEKRLTQANIEAYKRANLLEYRKQMDQAYKDKRDAIDDDDAMVTEYEAIDGELKNNMGQLVVMGTPDWQAIRDRIRKLRDALNNVKVTN